MFKTRPAKPEDTNFIFDSWLKSWRTSRYAGVVPNHLYFATYRATIECLVGRGAELTVACAENNEDHILGWVCSEVLADGKACIHYLYTKDPFLKKGIDKELLSTIKGTLPGFYSFNYSQVTSCLSHEWKWAPEIARRK